MISNRGFGFIDEEVGHHFDYGPILKALKKLKKKPTAGQARRIMIKHGCHCESAAIILHDLGFIPDLMVISKQTIAAITRKLKLQWSVNDIEDTKLLL